MGGMRGRIARSLQEVRDHGRRLAELNVELLKAELKRAAGRYGAAVGLFVGAALFAFFAFSFLLVTIAVALDIVPPLWAAMLIVTVLLFLLVAVLVLVGKALITSVKSPKSEKAMAEAQASAQAAKNAARAVFRRGGRATGAATGEATEAATDAVAEPSASASPPEPESPDLEPPEVPPASTGGDRAPD